MSETTTISDRHGRQIQLPPLVATFSAVQRLAEQASELQHRLLAERKALDEAARAVDQAKVEDRAALAVALRDGKRDPGDKATAAATAELERRRRLVAGLEEAAAGARRDLVAAIGEHAPKLSTEAAQRTAQARERFAAAVTKLEAEHGALQEALATEAWLREAPNGLGQYRPHAFAQGLRIAARADEQGMTVAEAFERFRALAEPPKPKARQFVAPGVPVQPLRPAGSTA